MSGTKIGGSKAAITNKQKHGDDFYARIGRKGGKKGHTGGFAANPELAREAGAKGGSISKRGPAKKRGNRVHDLNFTDEQIAIIKQELALVKQGKLGLEKLKSTPRYEVYRIKR